MKMKKGLSVLLSGCVLASSNMPTFAVWKMQSDLKKEDRFAFSILKPEDKKKLVLGRLR